MIKRTSIASRLAAVVAFVFLGASAAAMAKGGDPFVGNWQYDSAKSTFTGMPANTAGKLAITKKKKDYKIVADNTGADGKVTHYEYGGPADGSDLSVTGNAPIQSVTILLADSHTAIRTDRRAGKVVGMTTVTVDKAGKTMTSVGRGVTADNKTYSYSLVFNRVK